MNAIEIDHVTKAYRVGVGRARVREMVPWPFDRALSRVFPAWWTKHMFDALDNVSVAIEAGSSVGLIGHNGAGKTTLLKLIAGVTAPTSGRIRKSGRVLALIDLIIGFNPDLTGRENAYLLGALQGVGPRTLAARLDRIFEFADIDPSQIDTPVKRFSTGMAARLGFGIVSALDPEILLVDEVLSVGDARFQRKCVDWLDRYRKSGGTLVFVSHNLGLIRNMTQRVIWLDHGTVAGEGDTAEVLGEYASAMERRDVETRMRARSGARRALRSRGLDRWGAGGARTERVHMNDALQDGSGLDVVITYSSRQLKQAIFCLGLVDESGNELGAAASPPIDVEGGEGEVRCSIRPLPLRPGIYFPVIAILSPEGTVEDRWKLDRAIIVERNGTSSVTDDFGPVSFDSSWVPTVGEDRGDLGEVGGSAGDR